jgi:hypothetical protein
MEYKSVRGNMDESIANQFAEELNAGEVIEWCGKPQQGIYIKKEDTLDFLFSAVFGGVLLAIGYKLILGGPPIFIIFIGVLLAPFGFYMIIGKFIYQSWQRKKIFYAVTNLRIIIKYGIETQNTKTILIKDLNDINVNIRKNGKGVIAFGTTLGIPMRYRRYGEDYIERTMSAPTFEMIDEVQKVYDLIKDLQWKNNAKL